MKIAFTYENYNARLVVIDMPVADMPKVVLQVVDITVVDLPIKRAFYIIYS